MANPASYLLGIEASFHRDKGDQNVKLMPNAFYAANMCSRQAVRNNDI